MALSFWGKSGAGLGDIRQSSVAELDGKTSLPFIEPTLLSSSRLPTLTPAIEFRDYVTTAKLLSANETSARRGVGLL